MTEILFQIFYHSDAFMHSKSCILFFIAINIFSPGSRLLFFSRQFDQSSILNPNVFDNIH